MEFYKKHFKYLLRCGTGLMIALVMLITSFFILPPVPANAAITAEAATGAIVKSLSLVLREGAGTSFPALLLLKRGDCLTVKSYEGAWAWVEFADGLSVTQGYVAAAYLDMSMATGVLNAPDLFNVSITSGVYQLSWKILPGISRYAVFKSENGGPFLLHTVLSTKAESLCRYNPSALNPGSSYSFMVAGVRDSGQIGSLSTASGSVPEASSNEYLNPLKDYNYVISSPYGMRNGRMHSGVDMAAPEGTPIYAALAGTVIRSGTYSSYGLCVDIDHGSGKITRYAHCSELLVSEGDYVEQGSLIALVGKTGNATGSHLHFEIRINGEAVDPSEAIK